MSKKTGDSKDWVIGRVIAGVQAGRPGFTLSESQKVLVKADAERLYDYLERNALPIMPEGSWINMWHEAHVGIRANVQLPGKRAFTVKVPYPKMGTLVPEYKSFAWGINKEAFVLSSGHDMYHEAEVEALDTLWERLRFNFIDWVDLHKACGYPVKGSWIEDIAEHLGVEITE